MRKSGSKRSSSTDRLYYKRVRPKSDEARRVRDAALGDSLSIIDGVDEWILQLRQAMVENPDQLLTAAPVARERMLQLNDAAARLLAELPTAGAVA